MTFNDFLETLTKYDLDNIKDFIVNLETKQLVILIAASIVVAIIIITRRMARLATLIISGACVFALFHFLLPSEGQASIAHIAALFFGLAVIAAVAIYFIIIRSD